jgi:ElaB/YqjD/DUF883 family membrane-anchored ribosome-binding protein
LTLNFKEMILETTSTRRSRGNDSGFQGVVEQTLDQAKVAILETEETIRDNAAHAAAATEKYVGRNPWKSLAIATSIGFLLALLMRR